jgi:hypothetical protein
MIYTRQQGAQDARAYLAAVVTCLDEAEADRDDLLALSTAGTLYAMEQHAEWSDEEQLPAPRQADAHQEAASPAQSVLDETG